MAEQRPWSRRYGQTSTYAEIFGPARGNIQRSNEKDAPAAMMSAAGTSHLIYARPSSAEQRAVQSFPIKTTFFRSVTDVCHS
jgi:hypothetical protein